MSNVTLSASVRQNLLALQGIADMLGTTQNRLATGKKVNSALDNPTNFFTAQGLDNRASDINNLLDGISNGVQVLQAANTGITALQKLVDNAKSTANQALQAAIGYSSKSNVSTTIPGATPADLRGTTSYTNATAAGNVLTSGAAGGITPADLTSKLGGNIAYVESSGPVSVSILSDVAGTAGSVLYTGGSTVTATGATLINALTNNSNPSPTGPVVGDVLTVDNKTITFVASGASQIDSDGNYTIGIDQSVGSLLSTIDTINGNTVPANASTVNATGHIVLHSGVNSDLTVGDKSGGTVLAKLGLSAAGAHTVAMGSAGSQDVSSATKLFNTHGAISTAAIADGTAMTVNGKTITFRAANVPAAANVPTGSGVLGNIVTDGNGNSTIYLGVRTDMTYATVGEVLTAVDLASGVKSATITNGVASFATNSGQTASAITTSGTTGLVRLESSSGADLVVTGPADFLQSLNLTTSTGPGDATIRATRTTDGTTLSTLIGDGATLNVDGHTITFKNAAVPAPSASHTGITGHVETDGAGNSTVYLQTATVADILTAIDLATATQVAELSKTGAIVRTAPNLANSSISSTGSLQISTGTASDLKITGTGNAMAALGLAGNQGTATAFTATRTPSAGSLEGKTLKFTSFNGGTAVDVTFGDGTNGTVKTLNQLNAALIANNMTATIDASGKLTISAGNDFASSALESTASGGVMSGTVTTALVWTKNLTPVEDTVSQGVRANLVLQYNTIMDQISKTAQDASYNGINLLFGDQLQLVFNETGKSKLDITGVTYDKAGLGLANLTPGTDFIDNNATNKVLTALSLAQSNLRSLASTFGSNLSMVQTRQEFSKNLINVLQTGSTNLTIADTNEEAANSQALSTRQSIAVSALSLANQAQQSVLQLLR